MTAHVELAHGVSYTDARYVRPGLAASWLLVEGGRGAVVETGTGLSAPHVLAHIAARGLDPGDVDWVVVTHVHLDHAGGAGLLMRALPNARLVVHPRGARHMIDPTKLVAGATAVYGEAAMRKLFGEVAPIPADRVVEAPDGHVVELAGRPLRMVDTPGHAKHHFCVWDEASRGWFSGDTFGLSYRETDTASGAFLFPTTSPVQFDPDALHRSVDKMLAAGPSVMYLTHFGPVQDVARLGDDVHGLVDDLVSLAKRAGGRQDRHGWLFLVAGLDAHGCELEAAQALEILGMDIELNVQGLEVWIDRSAG